MQTRVAQRIFDLAYYALIAVALGVCSYWAVVLSAPPPFPTPLAPVIAAVDTGTVLNWSLFGDPVLSSAPKIELIGIIFSAKKASASRAALIVGVDKKVLAQGAQISAGYVVHAIKKDSVVIRSQGQEQVLTLPVRNSPATTSVLPTMNKHEQNMNVNATPYNGRPPEGPDLSGAPNQRLSPN